MIRRTKDAVVRAIVRSSSSVEDPGNANAPGSSDELEHILSIDHNKGRDDIEHTHVGDDGMRRDQGLSDFQLTLEVDFDANATVQQRLRDAEDNRSKLVVDYLYDGANGWRNICTATRSDDASGSPGELLGATFEIKAATGYLWVAV